MTIADQISDLSGAYLPFDVSGLVEIPERKSRKRKRSHSAIDLPQIDHMINYLPEVGPEPVGIFGAYGSGKSNLGYKIGHYCLKRGDALLFKGDNFCEWRHLLDHGSRKTKDLWTVNLLYPIDVDLFWYPAGAKEKIVQEYNLNLIPISLDDFNAEAVMKYLKAREVLAVYDTFLSQEARTLFWTELAETLVSRRKLNDTCITWIDNEASLLAPINAAKKQYKYIARLAEAFVEFRKATVRPIWVAQIETELDWRISKKISYRLYPGDLIPVASMPNAVRNHVLFSRRGKLVMVHGGKYRKNIVVPLFKELNIVLRIWPPRARIDLGREGDGENDDGKMTRKRKSRQTRIKVAKELSEYGVPRRVIAMANGVSLSQTDRDINDYGKIGEDYNE